MNVDLLSLLLQDLTSSHDSVALGEIGTFLSIEEGSKFTSQGYTLLPPQRKITFREQITKDSLLIDKLSEEHALSPQEAESILTAFLSELKQVLFKRKIVELPAFGLLRATRENNIFFVPFEDAVIDKENFALEPLQLKVTIPEPEQPAAPEQQKEQPAAPEAVEAEAAPDIIDQAHLAEPEPAPAPEHHKPVRSVITVAVIAALFVAIAAFYTLVFFFPDTLDSLLYSESELEIVREYFPR